MKAYVIVDVKIHDHSRYDDYKKLTPASLVPFDGKFIVRGGTTETLEGDWEPGRVVVYTPGVIGYKDDCCGRI